ncbi:cellulase family glycosylhydrolase [Chitinophaga pinensis]|uniref:cellulase family glycosylhydrolase n=1 Tax=Chitinophaga pinensis TaxID=79329 RepID=UPI001C99A09F|nr:cellulase family glycosylhydrolase [Chitinophaga pinensis]
MIRRTALLIAVLLTMKGFAQRPAVDKTALVYVDKTGVLRYTKDQQEAVFFGVNYTAPFAYGYRSHKALGADLKKAIDDDVYHLARLGIDAFRVHVWDTEITDAQGNLLTNGHLDLFDYLISKLKERKIKILLTPIAFWGNGYPEKDENTGSFSYIYGKEKALVNDTAIRAQENYVKQFFVHVNPYTGMTYKNDPDIIATEINNEPHHSGPQEGATNYVNRLAAAIRSTGWKKPVFYNISESPYYAAAVAKADIDGVSFQWYPTGLVANRTLQGNLLPNVDHYRIPFDTIPAFHNKARMVYEFDAGDVLQPVMYPAMARSFRTAGFQWATQFAYDPMATAYANTEYQTHYLNMIYTPEKAISLLIAGKVFHQLPRNKSYGSYPADTLSVIPD